MKLVYCVSIVSALLMLCEGRKWNLFRNPQFQSPPDPWPTPAAPATTTTTTTTTTAPKPTTTTRKPKPTTTPFPTTTAGRGVNLKGKMVTVSQYSGVTFYPPNYSIDRSPTTARANTTTTTIRPTTTTTTTTITTKPRTTTAWPTTPTRPSTTTAPVTKGVTVCLRFLTDVSDVDLFTLDPDYSEQLSFSSDSQWYILKQRYYSNYNLVSVNPVVPRWPSVRTEPWTSVCVVLDSIKNVVQVFQGGLMSVRKIPQYKMVWSGRPVLTVSGFDGQVTDLEVWDYPLKTSQIFSFMQNYGSSGNVLTWSNISYRPNGNILVEDVYELGQGPISSSEGEEQPIRSRRGRDQRLKFKKTFNGQKQRKRQMI